VVADATDIADGEYDSIMNYDNYTLGLIFVFGVIAGAGGLLVILIITGAC
jgi:hypothetical protein